MSIKFDYVKLSIAQRIRKALGLPACVPVYSYVYNRVFLIGGGK